MSELASLVAYHRWANRLVFELCRAQETSLLRAEALGTTGNIERTLKHSVGTEDAFLAILRGQDPREALGPGATYYRQTLEWFARRADEIADDYDALLSQTDSVDLDAGVKVPWFDHPVTRRDALLQALTHSIQHRAQVFSVLGERGIDVPSLDYIVMLQERAAGAS